MKPTRFLTVALVLMGLVATTSAATQAFTDITNQAFGNYQDANGNAMDEVESLIVTTTVSQVAAVSLGSDLANPMSAMDSTLYVVTLNNTGNYQDTFSIDTSSSVGSGAFDFYVYHDVDASGGINTGDTEVTSSFLVAFEGHYDLLIKVVDRTDGGADFGVAHTVVLTATSAFTGNPTDVVELVSTIQAAAVTGETTIIGGNTPAPGGSIVYESCFTNGGTETAYNPVFVTTMPSNTTLDLTSVKINDVSVGTVPSTALPATLTDVPYHYDTFTRILTMELSDLGFTTGVDDGVCVQFAAIVDNPLTAGASIDFPAGSPDLTYTNIGGDEYPVTEPTEDTETFPTGGVDVAQTYGVSLNDGGVNAPYAYTGDPGDTLIFDFTVTNSGNGADNFGFSDASDYVTWVYYLDANEDGVLSASEKTDGTVIASGELVSTGTTSAVGYYIAIGTIPIGTADGATDASTITATSQTAAALDPAQVFTGSDANSTTCTAPILTLVKTVSPSGNQPPGTELTYTIVVANSGTGVATTVVVTDAIPANTTYVAESMTVDTVADDDDNIVTSPELVDNAFDATGSVLFDFDMIPAVTPSDNLDMHTLTFKVTID